MARIGRCFADHRDPRKVEHSARELVAQRVCGLALGYEDLSDHDALCGDSLLALLVGKARCRGRRSPCDRPASAECSFATPSMYENRPTSEPLGAFAWPAPPNGETCSQPPRSTRSAKLVSDPGNNQASIEPLFFFV